MVLHRGRLLGLASGQNSWKITDEDYSEEFERPHWIELVMWTSIGYVFIHKWAIMLQSKGHGIRVLVTEYNTPHDEVILLFLLHKWASNFHLKLGHRFHALLKFCPDAVSWPSGLVRWTQVLVLSECGFESWPGRSRRMCPWARHLTITASSFGWDVKL